jgi:DNA-binding NarL/FixJ family response regulator
MLNVKDSLYRIVILQNNSEGSDGIASPVYDDTRCAEVVRFTIDGRLCGIVQEAAAQFGQESAKCFTDVLTNRELQIATLVALGRVNKQIAADLHISEWTVSSHLRRIFSKLGVRSRAALAFRCASVIRSP